MTNKKVMKGGAKPYEVYRGHTGTIMLKTQSG